jgi:hypothetical protein
LGKLKYRLKAALYALLGHGVIVNVCAEADWDYRLTLSPVQGRRLFIYGNAPSPLPWRRKGELEYR